MKLFVWQEKLKKCLHDFGKFSKNSEKWAYDGNVGPIVLPTWLPFFFEQKTLSETTHLLNKNSRKYVLWPKMMFNRTYTYLLLLFPSTDIKAQITSQFFFGLAEKWNPHLQLWSMKRNFDGYRLYSQEISPPLSPSFAKWIPATLFVSFLTVEKWRKHRRIITPAFNMRLMENFFEIFNRKNQTLIEELKKEEGTDKHFDLWRYIASTALDIICGEHK